MARRQQGTNPFYLLLVIAGIAFAVTAFAYGVMALKAISPDGAEAAHPLLKFLDDRGLLLMSVELGVLAVTCLLAMATDQYWSGRGSGNDHDSVDPEPLHDAAAVDSTKTSGIQP